MIYLDNAATGYPKPPMVKTATTRALTCYGANPGRGGYRMAMEASEEVYRCREAAAHLFGMADERCVVFVLNCTTALNIVLKSILQDGGRVVVSDLEHNAVIRPLHAMSARYPVYDIAHVTVGDDAATVAAFRRKITPHTRAIVCTHASNVIGWVLPIEQLAALAHEHGIPIVVDAAQSAGHISIDMERDGIDYLCVAGHKGLGGPMGTGMLLCRKDTALTPLMQGGTGSHSLSFDQPAELPERLESGTPNVAGLCGLRAGMEWVQHQGLATIEAYEYQLCRRLYERLDAIRGVRLYSPPPTLGATTPVISLTIDGLSVQAVGEALAKRGVAVRTGLHCAPLAHRTIGTLPEGTVRLSPGAFNTMNEIEKCAQIHKKIAENPLLFTG